MLDAHRLTVRIGRATLLEDVSVHVRPGEVVALCGPNGAGKSTLLRALCGEQELHAGEISLCDRALHTWSPAERALRLAVLPQQCHLSFPFTALEVVRMGRTPHARRARAGEPCPSRLALQATGCAHLATRLWPTLSGGEQQRVSLARVLCQLWECSREQPGCLLLDEPVASLDPAHQHATLALARDFAERGGGVLVSLHDLNLAAQHADRVLLLREGRLMAAGTPRDVLVPELIRAIFGTRVLALPHPELECPLIVSLPDRRPARAPERAAERPSDRAAEPAPRRVAHAADGAPAPRQPLSFPASTKEFQT